MATALSVRPDRTILGSNPAGSSLCRPSARRPFTLKNDQRARWCVLFTNNGRSLVSACQAGSRADDSAPFEMSLENALKVLGVSEGASFEDIVRARNSILDACKDDQETIAKVEAAYDMLLMQSLSQRRAGKVVSSSIRYADVKPVSASRMGSMPQWLQTTVRSSPISVEAPSTGELGVQAGVYGALMVLTYVNGASTSSAVPYAGPDVPGLILATSFGASLYFLTKKKVKLGENISSKTEANNINFYVIPKEGKLVEGHFYWVELEKKKHVKHNFNEKIISMIRRRNYMHNFQSQRNL